MDGHGKCTIRLEINGDTSRDSMEEASPEIPLADCADLQKAFLKYFEWKAVAIKENMPSGLEKLIPGFGNYTDTGMYGDGLGMVFATPETLSFKNPNDTGRYGDNLRMKNDDVQAFLEMLDELPALRDKINAAIDLEDRKVSAKVDAEKSEEQQEEQKKQEKLRLFK